ncbi:hypothetical protein [Brevundimonas sp.]|uniref:hypothetical protein n=1 Tax=Brevundimonas sp. TaxID=1871086 RepID=UPI0026062C11|nr:hypothetical protein [Brevundimonas sp.]
MSPKRRVWHLWLVGGLALLVWTQGAYDWLMMTRRDPGYLATVPADWQALVFGQPLWVSIAWAVAIWGLLFGAVSLFLGRVWAAWLLSIATAAILLDQAYVYLLHPDAAVWRAQGMVMPIILCLVFAGFAAYASVMAKRGVLR